MLDINFIQQNPEKVKGSVKRRGVDVDIDEILKLDKKRRSLIPRVEKLRARRNELSGTKGKPSLKAIEKAKEVKSELSKLEPWLEGIEKELDELLLTVPNLLHSDVPDGESDKDNVEVKKWGAQPAFDWKARDHEELGEELQVIDIKKAAEVSGSGFYFLKNEGVFLELALTRFALDLLTKRGFSPLITPELVRGRVAKGTGFIPQREEPDIYKVEGEDLWLSATAELPLTAFHMDEVLEEDELPRNYVGFSSCFRREAGAYGKHKKGIYRVHQFDKMEIYSFTKGSLEFSEPAFEKLIKLEEEIYQKLEIPYRVVNICTGDMSAPAYFKYDLEYWSPADRTYRELTSCSNCTDFQARRLNIRWRDRKGEFKFVHTLNGTAVTSTRTIIAILENYQQRDGSVKVPEVLRKYTGFKKIKPK